MGALEWLLGPSVRPTSSSYQYVCRVSSQAGALSLGPTYLVFHYITFTLPRPTTYYYKDGRRFGVFFQAGRPPVGRWTLAGGGVGVGASTLLRPPTPSLDFVETHCSTFGILSTPLLPLLHLQLCIQG